MNWQKNTVGFGSENMRKYFYNYSYILNLVNKDLDSVEHNQACGNSEFKSQAIDKITYHSKSVIYGKLNGVNLDEFIGYIEEYKTQVSQIDLK